MASSFASEIIRLHGHPEVIITDHNLKLMDSLLEGIHRLQGKTLSMSTAYHLQMGMVSLKLSISVVSSIFGVSWVIAHMNGHLCLGPSIGTIQHTRKLPR